MPGTYNPVSHTVAHSSRLLASTIGIRPVSIVLDTTAEDAGSPAGVKYLREGLLLAKVTATDTYKVYDSAAADGTEDLTNLVILLTDTDMTYAAAASQGLEVAALRAGAVYKDVCYGDLAGALANPSDLNHLDFMDR